MVHALQEVWRTLRPGGWMIDLRPVADHWPLEVVKDDTIITTGTIDGTLLMADQRASDEAISIVCNQKRFELRGRILFNIAFHWDSPEELENHFKNEWRNSARMERATQERLLAEWKTAGPGSTIRVLKKLEANLHLRVDN